MAAEWKVIAEASFRNASYSHSRTFGWAQNALKHLIQLVYTWYVKELGNSLLMIRVEERGSWKLYECKRNSEVRERIRSQKLLRADHFSQNASGKHTLRVLWASGIAGESRKLLQTPNKTRTRHSDHEQTHLKVYGVSGRTSFSTQASGIAIRFSLIVLALSNWSGLKFEMPIQIEWILRITYNFQYLFSVCSSSIQAISMLRMFLFHSQDFWRKTAFVFQKSFPIEQMHSIFDSLPLIEFFIFFNGFCSVPPIHLAIPAIEIHILRCFWHLLGRNWKQHGYFSQRMFTDDGFRSLNKTKSLAGGSQPRTKDKYNNVTAFWGWLQAKRITRKPYCL